MKNYNKNLLLEKWHRAYALLIEHEQNSDDRTLNKRGESYDHDKFLLLCKALEQTEDQLKAIGVTDKDYLTTRGVEVFTEK